VNVDWMTEQAEGKPAPVPLLAVQSFANTLDVEAGTDSLDSAKQMNRWLADAGLAARGARIPAADLQSARDLRTAVRRLLVANTHGESDPEAADALGGLARHFPIPIRADADGRLVPDLSPAKSGSELVAKLLGDILYAQATGTWERLKICENPECSWAFYDNSRNRSGTWCRMGLCGNRIKNRAYRERHRSHGD
jgi:predicted RNA-binding Zn ribbon-like protein